MQEDPGHAERIGDTAGMLAAGTAETGQRVFTDVIAALDGYFLDRIGHVGDRDIETLPPHPAALPACQVALAISSASSANFFATTSRSSGWSPWGPKTCGKKSGLRRPIMTLQSVTASGRRGDS